MTTTPMSPPIPLHLPTVNRGPDGKQYPFGWLGSQTRIRGFVIVESRRDIDGDDPDEYVVYREVGEYSYRREPQVWETMSEVMLAIVMLREGVNINTIAHAVPLLIGGIRHSAKEDQ